MRKIICARLCINNHYFTYIHIHIITTYLHNFNPYLNMTEIHVHKCTYMFAKTVHVSIYEYSYILQGTYKHTYIYYHN
jgi:hypothetical protein